MMTRPIRLILFCCLIASFTFCGGKEFDRYNELNSLRVLALQSAPVWPAPGETATLTPLVYVPDGDTVSYQWSWCPFSEGAQSGYQCAMTHEDLQSMIDGQTGGETLFAVPDYDLGTTHSVTFDHFIPGEGLLAACQGLTGGFLPDFVSPPDCTQGFPVTIKLVVSTAKETLTAVRELRLLPDATLQHSNPVLNDMNYTYEDGEEDISRAIPSSPLQSLARESNFDFYAQVTQDQAEPYQEEDITTGEMVDAQEDLIITWFTEGGVLEDTRTTYVENQIELEKTIFNQWETPSVENHAGETVALFFVIRDNRGGVSWLEREFALHEKVTLVSEVAE